MGRRAGVKYNYKPVECFIKITTEFTELGIVSNLRITSYLLTFNEICKF